MTGMRHRGPAVLVMIIALLVGCQARIAQPSIEDLPVAPEAERIDLALPSFSSPTRVDNPLFPVSRQASVLLLGTVDDLPFRTEVTLLPRTRIIEWEGRRVETLVSQYVAFSDGRINEVAFDHYAQADDGSVWYFGEDVYNFADGVIAETHGTWLAGLGGPACMIMPADPQVGDVYRPENMPGVVFEEVTVQAVDQTLDGPFGPVEGGIVVRELHMDGATEDKSFAPGYGEFYTSDGTDTEALALAVPTDAVDEPVPEALTTMEQDALAVIAAAEAEDWASASSAVDGITGAWQEVESEAPTLVRPLMADAIAALQESVSAEDAVAVAQAAIDVARLSLDVQLRHRPPAEIDLARTGLWARQLRLDAIAADEAAVNGDLFTLDYMRDRDLDLADADVTRLNYMLEELQSLVNDGDLSAIADAAVELEAFIAEVGGS